MRELTMAEAINEALVQVMRKDPNIIILGEDIGRFGGAFHVTHGTFEEFGPERVWDTPISEAGFMGIGIGAALTGLRPIVEFQYADFMFCAMDQIVNQAAKLRLMSGGQVSVPLVIRAPQGASGRAAQHSQSVEAYFMHTPGLKIVIPSTPYDAKGLLISSIKDDNPVLFFEHKLLYGAASPGGGKGIKDKAYRNIGVDVPEEIYEIPLGAADIKRAGTSVTIIATSLMVHKALEAAEILMSEGSADCEVIDPRTLVPLDIDAIIDSVNKTHKVVIVSEDVKRGGVGAELASEISQKGFFLLDAPIEVVCSENSPIPFAPSAEAEVIPQVIDIINAVKRTQQL
jgi:pyruvate dehydrogenase E1 component beta subunit